MWDVVQKGEWMIISTAVMRVNADEVVKSMAEKMLVSSKEVVSDEG